MFNRQILSYQSACADSWYWNSPPTPSVSWKQRSNTTLIRKQSEELSNVVRIEKWILGSPGVCISVYVYPSKWFILCICSDLQVKQAHARGQGQSYTPNTQIRDNDISLDWQTGGAHLVWAHSWVSHFRADIQAEQGSYCVTVPIQAMHAKAARITWLGSKAASTKRRPGLRSLTPASVAEQSYICSPAKHGCAGLKAMWLLNWCEHKEGSVWGKQWFKESLQRHYRRQKNKSVEEEWTYMNSWWDRKSDHNIKSVKLILPGFSWFLALDNVFSQSFHYKKKRTSHLVLVLTLHMQGIPDCTAGCSLKPGDRMGVGESH